MRILILSFYYRPDLSACAFRTTALVDALRATVPAGSQIDVVTTVPNRYHSFAVEAPPTELDGNVSVTRMKLPAHKSGVADQSRAFASFSRSVQRATAAAHYDIVYATSSRLMTAVLGAWIARRHRASLYLDIRDIFVDTIKDVLPWQVAALSRPIFSRLERWAITRASKVNLVSAGFSQYFVPRYPRQRFSFHTNGVDAEFVCLSSVGGGEPADPQRVITVLYAGNVGEGQGLHMILPRLARALAGRVRFRIVGAGGRMTALRTAVSVARLDNVELLDPLPRAQLIDEYRSADVLFLHLNDHEAFKKVLPSKIFEYAALGKPIWAGVAGYAAQFIADEVSNAAVFSPCDVEAAVLALSRLRIEDFPRVAFTNKYARSHISKAMAEDIVAVAGGK